MSLCKLKPKIYSVKVQSTIISGLGRISTQRLSGRWLRRDITTFTTPTPAVTQLSRGPWVSLASSEATADPSHALI